MAMSELKKWEALERYTKVVSGMEPELDYYPHPEVIHFVRANIESLKFRAAEKRRCEAETKPKPSEPDDAAALDLLEKRLCDRMDSLGRTLGIAVAKDIRFITSRVDQLEEEEDDETKPEPSGPDELQEINNRIDRVKHRHDVQGVQIREWSTRLCDWLDTRSHMDRPPHVPAPRL